MKLSKLASCTIVFSLLLSTPVAFAETTVSSSPTPTPTASASPTTTSTPTPNSQPEVLFSDISPEHNDYAAIQTVVQNRIMNGYGDGTFRFEQPITRAETTKVISLATKKTVPTTTKINLPFSDVSPQDPLLPFIQFSYDNKIVKGYPDKTFRPGKPVSRGEFLKIFTLATNSVFKDYNTGEAFLDVGAAHDLASYIYSARALDYISGSSNGLFYPNQAITRGEAAKIIATYLNYQNHDFPDASALAVKMADAINQKRKDEGKPPLTLDAKLSGIAEQQSQELYDQWHFLDKEEKKNYESQHARDTNRDTQLPWTSHRNASGLTFDQWFSLASKKFSIHYSEATQNIAHAFYDSSTPSDRVLDIVNKMTEKDNDKKFLYSHAYNLFGSYVDYTHIGIGIVVGDEPEEMYVTQILTK